MYPLAHTNMKSGKCTRDKTVTSKQQNLDQNSFVARQIAANQRILGLHELPESTAHYQD